MIERYGKYYEHHKGVPLPEKVKTKIELRFQHRIECRCAEMYLTRDEEDKWKSKDSNVMESDLSDVNSLTAIDVRERQIFYELRRCVVSPRIFIRSQS